MSEPAPRFVKVKFDATQAERFNFDGAFCVWTSNGRGEVLGTDRGDGKLIAFATVRDYRGARTIPEIEARAATSRYWAQRLRWLRERGRA